MSNNLNKKNTTDNVRRELLKGLATIPILGIFILNVLQKWRRDKLKKSNIMADFVQEKEAPSVISNLSNSQHLKLGIIGYGGRGAHLVRGAGFATKGWTDATYQNFKKNKLDKAFNTFMSQEDLNCSLVGVCDLFDVNADLAINASLNETRPGGKPKQTATRYRDYKELLANKEIDGVIIATPDHWHSRITIDAAKAGKHVYVEKPLTHNVYEARYLTEMARSKKIVTQMGNQGASNPDQLQIQKWIDNKVIGTISEVNVWTNRPIWPSGINKPKANASLKPKELDWDLWLGPAKNTEYIPNMHPFNWRGWWDYGTGALGDMGCHLMDVPFKALNLKYPTSVECSIGKIHTKMWSADYSPDGCPPSAAIAFNFDATSKNSSNIKFTWMDGGIKPFHPELLPPDVTIEEGGVMIIGEKGVITCNDYGYNPRLYLKGEPVIKGDMKKAEHMNI